MVRPARRPARTRWAKFRIQSCSKEKPPSSPARPPASASASPAPSRKDGANVVINGFGDAAAIEKERAGIEKEFGVKALYSPADMTKPAEIAEMIKTAEKTLRLGRHPGQQCRHPARRADRGIPDREMGPDHRHQSVVGVPHHPRRGARHEGAQMGPHHQHRLGAFAGRLAVQGRPTSSAKHGIAGLTKTVALELATFGITVQLHLARATSGRRWSRSRSPTR